MASSTVSPHFSLDPSAWDDRVASFVQTAERRREHFLRLARRVTPCKEEAEDIVQEAMLRAFRSLPRFRGDAQMSTWLQTIVQNAVREWLRENRGAILVSIESSGDEDTPPLDLPDRRRSPEDWCEHSEMQAILFGEIEKLGAIYRQAIRMCALEQISQEETARALQVTVPAIKTRVFHAKRRLRSALEKRLAARQN